MHMLRREESELSAIVNSIAGIFFFNTPHYGMNLPFLAQIVEGASNEESWVSLLSPASSSSHATKFEHVFAVDGCEIICFYATKPSPTPEKVNNLVELD